jgi:hypothetical protein
MHPKHWHYMEVSGQLHASAALPPGKRPRYALDRTLGVPHSRKDSVTLPGIEPRFPGFSAHSLFAVPTEVYFIIPGLRGQTKARENGFLSGRLRHAIFHLFLSSPFPINHPEDEWKFLYNFHNFIADTLV